MLKLRHLNKNVPLAQMLLANWEAEPSSFERFRISSNAIYPYEWRGETRFLRFAPLSERPLGRVSAELEFIGYLRSFGYGAVVPIAATNGALVVAQSTPWGEYVATAFHKVPGIQLSRTDLDDTVIASYGRGLAELHRLSATYRPEGAPRWTEADVLDWIRSALAGLPNTSAALEEANRIAAHLAGLPRDGESYGLVHYDFECDNVFFDAETGRCFAIDFDDAMYHWFAMDIGQAVDSLADDVSPELAAAREAVFLDGYASFRPLPDPKLRGVCQRFAGLYWYARVAYALSETLPDEPDWMTDLRARLEEGKAERGARFGTPL